jgi:hypothetical protein
MNGRLRPAGSATVAATRGLCLLVAALVAGGCANSAKLARKSQEQLQGGDPRKAYETALKAVEKDPYNVNAQGALRASGSAVLAHDTQRFNTLVPYDTLAAAEVALGMADLRARVAQYGVNLAADSKQAAHEKAIRGGAAAIEIRDGDSWLTSGKPKSAYAAFERAKRYDEEHPALEDLLTLARERATDRVLVLPYSFDTRTRVDARLLSEDMLGNLTRYAERNYTFTELADPGPVWGPLFGRGMGGFTRDAAYGIGDERDATRVAWVRIYGDRYESATEVYRTTVYRSVTLVHPDGTKEVAWREVPVQVRIEDRFVSVAFECEVHEVADHQLIARRTGERAAGVRAVYPIAELPGEPGDYALYSPAMWSTDRADCERRKKEWSDAFGTLALDGIVRGSRGRSRVVTLDPASAYGNVARTGKSYRVCSGRPAPESALLQRELGDVWKDLADALAEADRS